MIEIVGSEVATIAADTHVHVDQRSMLVVVGRVDSEGVARFGPGKLAQLLRCGPDGAEATLRRNVGRGIFAEGSTTREISVGWAYKPNDEECAEKLRAMGAAA